jgi:hypothetical protein
LGDSAGRLGRKIEDAVAAKIKTIIVSEGAIMMHVEEDMQEWEHFTRSRSIAVVYDPERLSVGTEYGNAEMEILGRRLMDLERYKANVDVLRDEKDGEEEDEECSRSIRFSEQVFFLLVV